MASVLSSATHTAHSLAASLLSATKVKPGCTLPLVEVKENSASTRTPLTLKGKNVIVGVPGAFTETCTNLHVPGYIANYEMFKAKGVNDIYIIGVNDVFVMQAWKNSLAKEGTPVHFVSDDDGTFTGSIGMMVDASTILGGPRSKRYVIITNDDKVERVEVEENASDVTSTGAEKVLELL
ncbi:hypothetical protein AX14_012534 [Amanita brunnescens Koide BX004]|nr:hypothetical protein AX14_012534 [Amanita brunnescens Koide BX004]